MALIFAGNKTADFTAANGVVDDYTSGFDSNFVKSAMRADNTTSYLSFTLPEPKNKICVGFRVSIPTSGDTSGTTRTDFLQIIDVGNRIIFATQKAATSSGNRQQTPRVIGGSTVTGSNITTTNTDRWDVFVEVTETDINVDIYINSNLIQSMTAAVGAREAIERIYINPFMYYRNFSEGAISEFIVSEHLTVGQRLKQFLVDEEGFYSDMEGNVLNLNNNDLALGLISDAVNQRHSWTLEPYTGLTTPIAGIVASSLARREGSEPEDLGHFLRIGGVNFDRPTNVITQQTRIVDVWPVNPATNANWSTDDLATLEFGVKSE